MRRCVGCGAVRPKGELHRLAAVDGAVVLDTRATLPGRGAYVCNSTCWQEALRRRAVTRALRRNVLIDPSLLESTS